MEKMKKSILIFGAMMVLCFVTYAQASCTLTSRVQIGSIRVSQWSCNDGNHTDVSYWDGKKWAQL